MYARCVVIVQLNSDPATRGGHFLHLLEAVRALPHARVDFSSCEAHTVSHVTRLLQSEGQVLPAFSELSAAQKSQRGRDERLFHAAFPHHVNSFDCLHIVDKCTASFVRWPCLCVII